MGNPEENLEALSENPYPGRGIVMGRGLGDEILQVYWVMGRSENSRNRILAQDGDMIRTEAFDPSKVEDPSLIIYNAMRHFIGRDETFHVVSNGDQTDTVINHLESGSSAEDALKTRGFEPDKPNFTPRITGVMLTSNWESLLWITRRDPETGEAAHQNTTSPNWKKGAGLCIHTYAGDTEKPGDALPSFKGRPYDVPLGESAEDTAEMYWENLDPDNRVAIVVKGIDTLTGEIGYHIINALEKESVE